MTHPIPRLRMACAAAMLAAAGLAHASPQPASAGGTADAAVTPATRWSGLVFLNASDRQRDGVQTRDEGLAVDLKRLYLQMDHRFNELWSAQVITDVQWHRNADPTDVWLRHAYLERRLGEHAVLQLGNAPTPWIAVESPREGYRYVDPGLIARNGLGPAADYGVHLKGRTGALAWAGSVITGSGFQRPRLGDHADVEVRLGWFPVKQLELAVGGYRGTHGADAGSATRVHTAQRWNAMASWVGERGRLGAQYVEVDNWNRVTRPGEDSGSGWSAWASHDLGPRHALFARHDRTRLSRRLDPALEERYSQLGVEWQALPALKLAVVGKRIDRESSTAASLRTDEVGVWGSFRF